MPQLASVWVLLVVAAWPLPGVAEALLSLGALGTFLWWLTPRGRRQIAQPGPAVLALVAVVFLGYWLPEAVSALDALDRRQAWHETLLDLRYLPFLWLVAVAVADVPGRRRVFAGIAVIAGAWAADALVDVALGTSPLYWLLEQVRQLLGIPPRCTGLRAAEAVRLAGVLGPCNPKLGIVLASLSPFVLDLAWRRLGRGGWLLVAASMGLVVMLAGSRAAWLTFALVLAWSGLRALGWRWLAVLGVAGALALAAASVGSAQVGERVQRTAQALSADTAGVDAALSGRVRIWTAAWCMVRQHPVNGVGVRGFREAWPACDPATATSPAWGSGPALHAHQLVLEVLSETGIIGLLLWLAAVAQLARAWRYADAQARERTRPALQALVASTFPLNTHLAAYSSFWGGALLLLAGLYAGSLWGGVDLRQPPQR